MFLVHTITIPPSKTHTTGTLSKSFWVSIIEKNPTAGVLQKGAVSNDVSRVITKGTLFVWAVAREVAEVSAKRTIVLKTAVLGMSRGTSSAVRAFVIRAVNTKMPEGMTVKTYSLLSCGHCWAQMGVSRDNSSGIGCHMVLVESGMRISQVVDKGGSNR